jgi:N-acetylglutamate synthase-like GNAT family acetyltransferase
MQDIKIRKAKISDRAAISRLTKKYPDTLRRTQEEIRKMIRNFWVAQNSRGRVVGCIGSKIWSGDAEIISWVVEKKFQGTGVAKKLLLALLAGLKKRKNVENIFVTTLPKLARRYFVPLGFHHTALQMFSAKVVDECQKCPKNCFKNGQYQCNEIALVLIKK